jgi:hypothetical protein
VAADMYEVLPVDGLPPDAYIAIATIKDPHAADCPLTCTRHKHERGEHKAGQVFDAADLIRGTNIDVLVQAGLIRKVEPKQADKPAEQAAAGKAARS